MPMTVNGGKLVAENVLDYSRQQVQNFLTQLHLHEKK